METKKEDSQDIELFWTLFNASLKEATDDNTVSFSIAGWCTDMAGADMNGLRIVFGEDALSRTKSCEFHHKESRNRMACQLACTVGDVFKDLCQNLLEANFEENYMAAKDALQHFIDKSTERQFLKQWLSWWDNRRSFILHAFSDPKMDLAELVSAGQGSRDNQNLSLLDVARVDVKDNVLLKAELKSIAQETSKAVGRGPTYHEKRTRSHHREVQKAAQLGQEVESLVAGLEAYPQFGYCPPDT